MSFRPSLGTVKTVPITCLLTISVIMFFIIGANSTFFASKIVLNPARTGLTDFYLWSVITGNLYESSLFTVSNLQSICRNVAFMNLFQLLFKLPVFTWLCAHLEKSFRTMWTAKYLFVVSATSAFVSSIIKVFLYVGSTDEKYLFHDMYGLGGILVTLFLGNILAEPNGRFYKNFEYRVVLLPYVIATFLLSLAGFQVNDVLLVISSLVVSLVYLRYNKPANLVINSEEIKLDVLFPAGVR